MVEEKYMKRIPNYSQYSATRDGRIYTHKLRKRWMVPQADKNGYLRVGMQADSGKYKGVYVHQAVALTYLPNAESKRFVNHEDHDKANNSVSNLKWVTHLENIQHDWKMGKRKSPPQGDQNWNSKTTETIVRRIRKLYEQGVRQTDLARDFGISQPTISQITRGVTWRNIL